MKNNNSKKAFSLIGVIMVLIIVFATMMFTIPFISGKYQKTSSDFDNNVSGKYVCYENPESEGSFINQYYTNGNLVKEESKANCQFNPPQNAQHLNIQITGGGSGGGGIPKFSDSSISFMETFDYETGYKTIVNLALEIQKFFVALEPHVKDIDSIFLDYLRKDNAIFNDNNITAPSNNDWMGKTTRNDYKFGVPVNKIPIDMSCIYYDNDDDNKYQAYRARSYTSGLYGYVKSFSIRDVGLNTDDNKIANFERTKNGPKIYKQNYVMPLVSHSGGSFGIQSCGNIWGDDSKLKPFVNSAKRFSAYPYLNFIFRGEQKLIYSGQGGNPGKTISHLTTNIKVSGNNDNSISITLGKGGEGGNCYSSGGYLSADCKGSAGSKTIVTIGDATITAEGGKVIDNPAPDILKYVLPLDNAIQNFKQSLNKISNGKRSQLHNSDNINYQTGDGGDGARMKDKCKLGKMQYKVEYCGFRGENVSDIPTNDVCNDSFSDYVDLFNDWGLYNSNNEAENVDGVCKDNSVVNDFEYIDKEGNTIDNDGFIGKKGQGGVVVITW